MVPKTSEEIAADHAAHEAEIEEVRPNGRFGVGLGAGAVMGVVFYFVTVWALPYFYASIDLIK